MTFWLRPSTSQLDEVSGLWSFCFFFWKNKIMGLNNVKSSLSSKIFCISWLPWSGWISQRKSLLAAEMKQARVCVSCLVMSNSATPWTVAHQTPLSLGFSRQEYWSGLHFLLQGIFPTQGSKLGLLHCRQVLYCLSYREFPGYLYEQTHQSCSGTPLEGSCGHDRFHFQLFHFGV